MSLFCFLIGELIWCLLFLLFCFVTDDELQFSAITFNFPNMLFHDLFEEQTYNDILEDKVMTEDLYP